MAKELKVTGDNHGNLMVECPVCKTNQIVFRTDYHDVEEARLAHHQHKGEPCAGSYRVVPGFIL